MLQNRRAPGAFFGASGAMRLTLLLVLLVTALGAGHAWADRSSTTPKPRDEKWIARANALTAEIDRSSGKIVILGDSIAAMFPRDVQVETFGDSFVNLGIGGDCTEHLLWRLPLYDLSRAQPRAVILIIGTNNLRTSDAPDDIVAGILAIVRNIRRQTSAPLIVSEILPRGHNLDFRQPEIAAINAALASAASAEGFILMRANAPITAQVESQGMEAIFRDTIHPNAQGYRILAAEIGALLPAAAHATVAPPASAAP